jgi:hypothetical protein
MADIVNWAPSAANMPPEKKWHGRRIEKARLLRVIAMIWCHSSHILIKGLADLRARPVRKGVAQTFDALQEQQRDYSYTNLDSLM